MDENSQIGKLMIAGFGAIGLGAVASAFFLPLPVVIILAISILVLALLVFGGYFLWGRLRSRRERESFSSAIEAQTAATPKAISDPNKRADLDRVRQKFQTGLQEFKSRGKDIYKLPWYVIIGESGSGKTEAIRHSGIDFPPGLQDELQGSGGTVNMDWWFTNRGIILDTAGSMLFNEARAGEAPEWREFLRLLKRARPHCPVNGLFLVLSVESLIRDSADKIAQKASRLAQQLDLIQRTLDVRFPVYLLVTKCDLLTGFREFFDNIDDPLLQHQMFGWSNPDPLDSHFRPDLVEEHLRTVSARLRRRRMALIRDISGTGRLGDTQQFFAASYQLGRGPTTQSRRLDEVDSLFALPESVMRLAPRLRRYLETIFVAGEWSAKPVFLRGIYFTSSMREGKALDEAIALATGLSLDQLPEERSWEKNRAFFLRDLFHDKVFRESGLVTRATNTLKLLRQRQLLIFGTAGAALLLLLVFSTFAYLGLKRSVAGEASYWQAASENFKSGAWSPAIVSPLPVAGSRFAYGATNVVPGMNKNLVQFQKELRERVESPLKVSWIFKPMAWLGFGDVRLRPDAQRQVLEAAVVRPLVRQTEAKLSVNEPSAASLGRYQDALLSVIELQADAFNPSVKEEGLTYPEAGKYLRSMLAFLAEEDVKPDTNLVRVLARTYSKDALRKNGGAWPPKDLASAQAYTNNLGVIRIGLEKFQRASLAAQTNVQRQALLLDNVADKLQDYHQKELTWLSSAGEPCPLSSQPLGAARRELDTALNALAASTNLSLGPLTNIGSHYMLLAAAATNASAAALSGHVNARLYALAQTAPGRAFSASINEIFRDLATGVSSNVWSGYYARAGFLPSLDAACFTYSSNSAIPAFELRWSLYTNACILASTPARPDESTVGSQWAQYDHLKRAADLFRTTLAGYNGPFAAPVSNFCARIASNAEQKLQAQYVDDYVALASARLARLASPPVWNGEALTNAAKFLAQLGRDLQNETCAKLGPQAAKLDPLRKLASDSQPKYLAGFDAGLRSALGFPLVLDAQTSRTLPQMSELKKDLNGAAAALLDPVWQPADAPGLLQARKDCGLAVSVVKALVKDDGTPVEWQLFYVPPPDTAPEEDKVIVTIFRAALVSSRNVNAMLPDLTKADATRDDSCFIARLPADAGISLSFRRRAEDSASEPGPAYSDWGLVRLIRAGKAVRSEDGARWKFSVPLAAGGHSGSITFEARLDAKQPPLPKPDEWLKSR